MNKHIISFFTMCIAIVFSVNGCNAQIKTVDFGQLDSLHALKPKKVVVFIHTDCCKYCNQMKHTTFSNDSVIKVLNNHFYLVNLNAEFTEDINYGGHTFKYRPTGGTTGVHELAEQLATIDGKMNYPTISIINSKNEIVFQYSGLMKTAELLTVLKELETK